MSRTKLINAFNALAEAAALVALELEADSTAGAGRGPSTAPPPPVPVDTAAGSVPSAPPPLDTSMCPKHLKTWTPSKNPEWPAYCTSTSDDPAWSNPKGYCRINSKNAGEWLQLHGRAA